MADDATPADDGSDDCMRPPDIPIEVHCIHCGEEYQSYLMEYRIEPEGSGSKRSGFWCCPTPGCGGMGFLFDIYPTDPDWRDEHGERVCFFTDDDEEFEDEDDAEGSEDSEDDWLPVAEDDDDEEWNEDFYEAMDAEENRAREERTTRKDPPARDHPRPESFDDFNEDDIPF